MFGEPVRKRVEAQRVLDDDGQYVLADGAVVPKAKAQKGGEDGGLNPAEYGADEVIKVPKWKSEQEEIDLYFNDAAYEDDFF